MNISRFFFNNLEEYILQNEQKYALLLNLVLILFKRQAVCFHSNRIRNSPPPINGCSARMRCGGYFNQGNCAPAFLTLSELELKLLISFLKTFPKIQSSLMGFLSSPSLSHSYTHMQPDSCHLRWSL